MKQSIKTLEEHNAWRRGADTPQGSPMLIGMAIDDCINNAKRYELVRSLNPIEFKNLYEQNIKQGENFESMIDEIIKIKTI